MNTGATPVAIVEVPRALRSATAAAEKLAAEAAAVASAAGWAAVAELQHATGSAELQHAAESSCRGQSA